MKKVQTKNKMKGLFGLFATLAMALGIGVAIAPKNVMKAEAELGETKATFESSAVVTAQGYSKYENEDWLLTYGGNNVSGGTNKNSRDNAKLTSYSKYAVSPVKSEDIAFAVASKETISDIGKITFEMNGGKNNTRALIYLLASNDNLTFSQIDLTGINKQGHSAPDNLLVEFEFDTIVGPSYYAIVFKDSGNANEFRLDNIVLKFIEGSTAPKPVFGTLNSIVIKENPTKTSFSVGDAFSSEGLILTASDDSTPAVTKDITKGYTTDYDDVVFESTDVGTKVVTVWYKEGVTQSTTYKITITPKLSSVKWKFESLQDGNVEDGTKINIGDNTFDDVTFTLTTSNNSATVGGWQNYGNFQIGAKTSAPGVITIETGNTWGGEGKYSEYTKINSITFVANSGVDNVGVTATIGNEAATVVPNKIAKQTTGPGTTIVITPGTVDEGVVKITTSSVSGAAFYFISLEIDASIPNSQPDPFYEEANAFADYIMAFDGGGENGMTDAKTCEDNFFDAWAEWYNLTPEAKAIFKSNDDFENARKRLLNWVYANGLTSLDDLDFEQSGPGKINTSYNENSPLTLTLIIGVIGLTTLAGYYFIQKKQKLNK